MENRNSCQVFTKKTNNTSFMCQRKRLCFNIIILFFLLVTESHAQSTYKGFPSLIWPKLYTTKFEKAKDQLGEYDKPIFTDATKALNGKTVSLPGYMVPFESGIKGSHFMFTSMPLNACFFCGVRGPETVVEVFAK